MCDDLRKMFEESEVVWIKVCKVDLIKKIIKICEWCNDGERILNLFKIFKM